MQTKLSNSALFVWILLLGNAITIGMYFSGSYWLQQIIAPSLDSFAMSQSREFGLLEFIQNVLLLSIVVLFLIAVIQRKHIFEKLFFAVGLSTFTFLLLEETDYGLHYYEFLTGQIQPVTTRNWHNQWNDGLENATRLKLASDAATVIWFILLPLLNLVKPVRNLLQRINIIPSTWFIAGFMVALSCSKTAHYLDDNGYSVINGVNGNLTKTISEFRETSVYYLYLLYAIQLIKTSPLLLIKTKAD